MAPFSWRWRVLGALTGVLILAIGAFALASQSKTHHPQVQPGRAASARQRTPTGQPPSYDQQRTPTPNANIPPPGPVARRFVRGWLACTYHHAPCTQIAGVYPAYARLVEPQLSDTPVTHADMLTHPKIISLRLVYNCPLQVVAIATYNVGPGPLLQLHPNLVREHNRWQVYAVPEFPAQIPLPHPLTGGVHFC